MTISRSAEKSDVNPRVASYPPYGYSSGDDAIDLAEVAGLILDPWQQLVLRHALGERDDGKWSAFEVAVIVARQNGKGAILEARELAGLFLFRERLILHSAHEYRTAMEAFRRVRDLVENCDELRRKVAKVVNTNGEEGIELLSGARLKFIARSKNAGRGFSADCLIWDEAYALTEDQVDAQMPTLSARPNAQVWYTSSPPLDAISGAQLFRVRRRAEAGDPQGLAYFDWGLAARLDKLDGVNLDDRTLWAATNPAYEIRVSEEAIERERAAMSDEGFARERLSMWPPDFGEGFQIVSAADWAAAASDSGPLDPVAFAVEVTFDRSMAAIVAVGPHADGQRRVIEVIDHRPGTDWIAGRARELTEKWGPVAWGLAVGGPAGSLVQPLADVGIAAPVGNEVERGQLWVPYARELGGACGAFVDGIRQGTLAHRSDPRLSSAVGAAKTRPMGDSWMFARRDAGDISPLVAATVALGAYEARKYLASVVAQAPASRSAPPPGDTRELWRPTQRLKI